MKGFGGAVFKLPRHENGTDGGCNTPALHCNSILTQWDARCKDGVATPLEYGTASRQFDSSESRSSLWLGPRVRSNEDRTSELILRCPELATAGSHRYLGEASAGVCWDGTLVVTNASAPFRHTCEKPATPCFSCALTITA